MLHYVDEGDFVEVNYPVVTVCGEAMNATMHVGYIGVPNYITFDWWVNDPDEFLSWTREEETGGLCQRCMDEM